MKKIFEHTDIRGRISERLDINECGGGIYFAVHAIEESPIGDIFDESRLSTVIPYSEIPELIQSLSKVSSGWAKPSDHLPTHEQDCIVCRLVDGQCRVYQSQYYAGQIIQGFGDLDDGESFYDDVLYWMPVDMADIYKEIKKELKSETCNSNKKPK